MIGYFQAPPLEIVAPHLHARLAPRYRTVSVERLDAYIGRTLGGAPLEAVEDFLGTLAQVGQAVLPVLLPAIGTAIGGPVGGAIGAGAGAAATAGIKGAMAGKGSPPATPPPKSPPAPAGPAAPTRPASGRAQPKRSPVQRQAPVQNQSLAAAQLLALLLSPELLQALGQLLLGSAGKSTVKVHGETVPIPALLSLASELADRAAVEALGEAAFDGSASYMESNGYDTTSAEERARALWELFSAARAEDMRAS